MSGDVIRVRLSHGETGWGKRLSGNRIRVENIPFEGKFNYGDVVEIASTDKWGLVQLGRVLQRKFSGRSIVRYPAPFEKNYRTLVRAFEAEDVACEGATEGMMMVAHKTSFDPIAIAKTVGIVVRSRADNIRRSDMLN